MYLTLCPSKIRDLSAEQLQYIPKVLCIYGDYIKRLGQASGTREGRFGGSNLSSSTTISRGSGCIVSPASKIKDCNECRRRAAVCER